MKSAYELAMERMDKEQPRHSMDLSDQQKTAISDVKNRRDAKLAERRIMYDQRTVEAKMAGDGDVLRTLQEEFVHDSQRIRDEAEQEIAAIRNESL